LAGFFTNFRVKVKAPFASLTSVPINDPASAPLRRNLPLIDHVPSVLLTVHISS